VLVVAVALTLATIGVVLVARPALAPSNETGLVVKSPSPTLIPMPTTVQLSASSDNVVWAYVANSALFRSTDRGDTWERRPVPESIGQGPPEVSFVDDGTGWFSTGGSLEGQCTGAGIVVWRTLDAGASWKRVGLIPGLFDVGITGYPQCEAGLSFVDGGMLGFLPAWDDSHPSSIYRSSDDGQSWGDGAAKLRDPPGFRTQAGGYNLRAGLVRSFGPCEPAQVGESCSLLLVPVWGIQPGTQAESQYVFTSTDGINWFYLATAPSGSSHVTLVSWSRWLELSAPGQSVETTDAGKTWHPYPSDYSQAAPVAPQIVFGDALVGYATVRGSIQRTVDGGLHWTYIKTPGT
jgi:photosystem II stability/assembly factor-like uncharacterized protein